jgi:hypothetical protein
VLSQSVLLSWAAKPYCGYQRAAGTPAALPSTLPNYTHTSTHCPFLQPFTLRARQPWAEKVAEAVALTEEQQEYMAQVGAGGVSADGGCGMQQCACSTFQLRAAAAASCPRPLCHGGLLPAHLRHPSSCPPPCRSSMLRRRPRRARRRRRLPRTPFGTASPWRTTRVGLAWNDFPSICSHLCRRGVAGGWPASTLVMGLLPSAVHGTLAVSRGCLLAVGMMPSRCTVMRCLARPC